MLKNVWNKYKISIILFLLFIFIILCTFIAEFMWPTTGANIGAGITLMVAVFVLFLSLVTLSNSLKGWIRIVPILVIFLLIFLWLYGWNINETQSNIIYCTDPDSGIDKIEKGKFCSKYQ